MEKNFPGLAGAVIRRDIFDVPTREILRTAGYVAASGQIS